MNGLELDEDRGPVLIAIDTDENEDLGLVADTVASRGNQGLFAVSPIDMTQQLVSQFGPSVITPPTSPVIIISADQQSAELLERGIKSQERLEEVVEEAR